MFVDKWCESGRSVRRLIAASIAGLAFSLMVAGCGGGSGNPSTGTTGGHTAGPTSATGASVDGTVLYGALPPTGTPVHGGTVSFGQLSGATPTEIFPMLDGGNASAADFELNGAMYLQLYSGPSGAVPKVDYAQSVASGPPRFSDAGRTVTIPLRQGLKWSNGQPVVANDVLFYIALVKAAVKESAANWAQFTPGQFPNGVTSATAPNSHTVVLHLSTGLNPGYFVYDDMQDTGGGVYPLPSTDWNVDRAGGPHLSDWRNPAVAKEIYDYLNKVGQSVATFNSNPLWHDVDGAFKLKSFSATNGSYDLVPNPGYGLSPKPVFANLSVETLTSETAALDALKSGAVDVIPVDPTQLGLVGELRSEGISVFGGPSFGWNAGIINFKDKTDDFDHVIAQRYVRAALEHLVDEPVIIKDLFKGTAAPAYGPVPSAPSSPYAPADAKRPQYPYDPPAAAALLQAHGWKVAPGGQSTCAKPGTGSGECGAGIPAGTPLKFSWLTDPGSVAEANLLTTETIASIAKKAAGIDIAVDIKSANILGNNYNDAVPGDNQYRNDWGVLGLGALLIDYYPTQSGYDSPGALDIGGYDSPTENRLINASLHSGDLHAVENETSFITKDLPGLYLPNPDYLFAVAKGVGGPPASWTVLTENSTFFPQYWYRTK